jgi:hypothetical protein
VCVLFKGFSHWSMALRQGQLRPYDRAGWCRASHSISISSTLRTRARTSTDLNLCRLTGLLSGTSCPRTVYLVMPNSAASHSPGRRSDLDRENAPGKPVNINLRGTRFCAGISDCHDDQSIADLLPNRSRCNSPRYSCTAASVRSLSSATPHPELSCAIMSTT